jgi:hypothetical protein
MEKEWTAEGIARIAWEANRALQIADDEDWPDEPWDGAPEWRKNITVGTVVLVRGGYISAEQAHEHWAHSMKLMGWTWSHEKNLERKKHPSLVPWDELTPRAQLGQRLLVLITQQVMLTESNTRV